MKGFNCILIYCIFGNIANIYSQLTPEWQSMIYIQDAKGNRDSLRIGIQGGLSEAYNPEYGEKEVSNVLDSVLDIRGVEFSDFKSNFGLPHIFTNPLIGGAYDKNFARTKECYWTNQRLNIGVYAKYQPVTISWDQAAFKDECLSGTWITTSWISETVYQWYNGNCDNQYQCMAGDNSVTWYLPNACNNNKGIAPFWVKEMTTTDGRTDTLWNIQIVPAFTYYFDTPCRFSPVGDITDDSFLIYPNPAHSSITIQSERKISEYRIFRSDGVLENGGSFQNSEIDISHLTEGIKWIEIHYENGHIIRSNFLKL